MKLDLSTFMSSVFENFVATLWSQSIFLYFIL